MRYTLEIELDVEYGVKKGCEPLRFEPGEPDEVTVDRVMLDGKDVTDALVSMGLFEQIQEACEEDHAEGGDSAADDFVEPDDDHDDYDRHGMR